MKNYLIGFSLILASLIIASCSDDRPENLVIDLGTGVNELKIGDSGSEAAELFGSYVELNNLVSGNEFVYTMNFGNYGVQLFMGSALANADVESLNIESMRFVSPFDGLTEEGIGIGSTLEELVTAYGAPASIDSSTNDHIYNYDAANFIVDNDRVFEIDF